MNKFTVEQRVQIGKIPYKNSEHFAETVRKNHPRWRSPFSSQWLRQKADQKHLGHGESKSAPRASHAPTTVHCLMWISGWRCHWAILLRKCSNCDWCPISRHVDQLLSAWNCWYGSWRHVVSTGRCHLPHSQRYNAVIANEIRREDYLAPRWCELATEIMRFDAVGIFLWGLLKGKVYANKPQTIPELKQEIQLAIEAIEPQLCQNVIENFTKRVRVCQQARGGHLSDIIFHH